ncbi:MAG: NAD-dependent epimerase/dehydratase family protein [Actinomycetota bacterium]
MTTSPSPSPTGSPLPSAPVGTSPLTRPVVLGAGPVGRAIVDRLVDRGLTPTVVTRSGTAVDGAKAAAIDVADTPSLAAALAPADAVFHAVMPPYSRWPELFPPFQAAIVRACEQSGGVLVSAENLYGYGTPGVPITEQLPLAPTTTKGRVRAELWRALAAAHEEGAIRAAAVRASDFFGPGVIASAYGESVFGRLAAGKKAQVLGDPGTRHSITYVPDYAEALVRVAERPATWGRAWIAPTAPAVAQAEVVALAAEALGVDPGIQRISRAMLRLAGLFNADVRETVEMFPEFTHDFVVDSAAAEAALDLAPTDLETAIAHTAGCH